MPARRQEISTPITESRLREIITHLLKQAVNRLEFDIETLEHGELVGLTDDDHPQYALTDKSRPSPWVSAADLSIRSIADLGTRDHDLLTGLLDDDHTQYMLGAGAVTDNRIPRFVGTGGRTVENTQLEITDAGDLVMSNGGLHKIHFDDVVNDTFIFASATKQLDFVVGGSVFAVLNGDLTLPDTPNTEWLHPFFFEGPVSIEGILLVREITPPVAVQDMAITAGAGLGGGGGILRLTAGAGLAAAEDGGALIITTGSGTSGIGAAAGRLTLTTGTCVGNVGAIAELIAGNAQGSNRAGGAGRVVGGNASGTAKGGAVELTPGTSPSGAAGDVTMNTTTAAILPVGTTAQQPAATNGSVRYDSTTVKLRAVENAAWRDVFDRVTNFSVTAQSPAAATRTYITGSALAVPPVKLKVGTCFRWRISVTKTAAGIASSTYAIAFGTAGTTADTDRVTFTKPAGTADADEGVIEINCIIRTIGATGVAVGEFAMAHNGNILGHAIIPVPTVNTISAGFDMTVASLIVGLTVTSGASDAITFQLVQAEAWNL